MMPAEAGIGRLLTDAELEHWPDGALRTASLVNAGWALTAWHCLKDLREYDERLWLRLQPRAGAGRPVDVPIRYAEHDSSLDIALLAVEASPGIGDFLSSAALSIGRSVAAGDLVRVGGFPESNRAPYAVLFGDRVESADTMIGRHRAVRVFVDAHSGRSSRSGLTACPEGRCSCGCLIRRNSWSGSSCPTREPVPVWAQLAEL